MKNFELEVKEINTLVDLNSCFNKNKKHSSKEYLMEAQNKSYNELWNEKFSHYESTKFKNKILCLEFIATLYTQEISEKDWVAAQLEYFKDEFERKNIISIMTHTHNGYMHTHIIICPVVNGIIDPSRWENKETIIKEKKESYYRKMSILFLYHKKKNENAYKANEPGIKTKYGLKNDENDKEIMFDALQYEKNQQTTLPKEEITRIFKETIKYYTKVEFRIYRETQYGRIPPDEFLKDVKKYLREKHNVPEEDLNVLLNKMYNAVFEYYVLEKLLNDDNISDIKVLAPDKIRIKYKGKRMTSNMYFIDEDDYWRFLEGVAIRNHTNLEPENAVQNFTDKTSNEKFILRFNISTNYVNSVNFPYLHIRKINKSKYTMWDLIEYGMLDKKLADYLINKVRNGKGFVFTGKGGSGKTTLFNAMIEYIPYNKSALFIQENEELFSNNHPDMMFQHIVTAKNSEETGYSLKDLTRNSLLCDLDAIGIGEVKGDEALYLLNAIMTGAQGWCSVHSYDAPSAIDKLADYIKYASDYPKKECMYMLKELEVIIFMKDFKIYEIQEIIGWDDEKEKLIFKEIYKRNEGNKEELENV